MARQLAKLSARTIATEKRVGRHGDGGGLYLVVDKSGAKRWVFLFRWRLPGQKGTGRLREMGLGSLLSVSAPRAREKATSARAMVADGIDPIATKNVASITPTFGTLADGFLAAKTAQLRSPKSVARVRLALEVYAAPLREKAVDQVSVDDVLAILKPIWVTKSETGHNTRTYVEAVLDAAKARGFRFGDNPARWKGHLDHLLPRRQKLTRGHHASLPYGKVPKFITDLRTKTGMAALVFEFTILTAARSGESLGAKWIEIDLDQKIWTIPAGRMKSGRLHRVPLSERALIILKIAKELGGTEYVFEGRPNKPLSGMAMEMIIRRMDVEDATVHGFRSSFRDWAGEETSHPREVAEAALAHTVGDQTERAYRRGDALEKRRKLMDDWNQFCTSPPTK